MEYCAARLIDTLECFFPEAVRAYLRSKMRSRSTSRLISTYAYFLCVNRLACSSRMAPKPSHNGSGEAEKRCHPPGGKVSPSGCWYPAKRFASRVDPRTGTEASPRTRAPVRCSLEWCAGEEFRFTGYQQIEVCSPVPAGFCSGTRWTSLRTASDGRRRDHTAVAETRGEDTAGSTSSVGSTMGCLPHRAIASVMRWLSCSFIACQLQSAARSCATWSRLCLMRLA